MADSEQKAAAALAEERAGDRRAPARAARPRPPGGRAAQRAAPLKVYKPRQGPHVRWGSAAGGAVLVIGAAQFLYEQLAPYTTDLRVRVLVPVGLLVVLGYLLFRLVGRNRAVVDFMIATEGEMKKVNWSSRKEVFGATRVVIVMVLALGCFLFAVNLMFITLFSAIGVLRIPILQNLLGGAEQGA